VTKQEIDHEIEKLQEKKAQVESDIDSLKAMKKPESRERRHVDEKPVVEKGHSDDKDDGTQQGVGVTPTEKTVPSTDALSLNDTDVQIVSPNSSAPPSVTPSTIRKTLGEATGVPHVANDTGTVVKGRELKSNDVRGRKLKSKDLQAHKGDSKIGKDGGYGTLWVKRLVKQRSLRANKLNKVSKIIYPLDIIHYDVTLKQLYVNPQ
jgi:hypothetical protein